MPTELLELILGMSTKQTLRSYLIILLKEGERGISLQRYGMLFLPISNIRTGQKA
jgi:hypothetical protein